MLDLSVFAAVMLDIDGVLTTGERLLPGARELLGFFDTNAISYALVTNSAVQTPAQKAGKLRQLGLDVEPERIITSALAVRDYLEKEAAPQTPIYAVGMDGLQAALFGDNRFVYSETMPQYVVVSHHEQLTYTQCRLACQFILEGACFIVTNPDLTVPTERGPAPETGALQAYLQAATNIEPRIIGKPMPDMFRMGLAQLSATAETTLMIGDRLDTDIAGAHRAGLAGALVLTGVTDPAALHRSVHQPNAVFADLPALLEQWQW